MLVVGATLEALGDRRPLDAVATILVGVFGGMLATGSIVYQVSRRGHLRRWHAHRGAPYRDLRHFSGDDVPSVVVLVPSYREDPEVVRRTLLSAALQEYVNHRVVLLIDDPPEASRPRDVQRLLAARQLPGAITTLFAEPARAVRAAAAAYEDRRSATITIDRGEEARTLADVVDVVAAWLEDLASAEEPADHAHAFFKGHVLMRAARRYRAHADELAWHAERKGRYLKEAFFEREYRRLVRQLDVRVTSFERKRYANLSHAPNKAMNLNSYIGLLGNHVRETAGEGSVALDKVSACDPGSFLVADADYVLTLDADSVLLPDYTLRLVHLMEQPRNRKVAVAQTPYSAFPEPATALERAAGATTDIQYLIHQGFAEHNATFWVGANALLRKRALDEIAVDEVQAGEIVRRYISDRTVIEDTESSVDLVAHGWTLVNYPARLAYSATPPDFGALIVQRRRWANGGLLILPKLLRYLATRPLRPTTLLEALLRVHYLASIAAVNVALVVFLLIPLPDLRTEAALLLTALPYYLLYARDLVMCGYRRTDAMRVYALNLLLVPVNLAGVLRSMEQAARGRKATFGRTPKVAARTSIPVAYRMAIGGLLFYCALCSVVSFLQSEWVHASFGALNAAFVAYGITTLLRDREVTPGRRVLARAWGD